MLQFEMSHPEPRDVQAHEGWWGGGGGGVISGFHHPLRRH